MNSTGQKNVLTLDRYFKPTPRQIEAMWAINEFDYVLYGGAGGGGKLLDLSTPVPTPSGWTTMGQLRNGDVIFDENGKPTTVIIAHPVVDKPVSYRLTFDDGSTVNACAGHLWLTYNAYELAALTRRDPEWRAARRAGRESRAGTKKSALFRAGIVARNKSNPTPSLPPPTGSIRTTKEIAGTLMKPPVGRGVNHAIPVCGALDLPDIELPLDPYLLGAWLGDGSSNGGGLTGLDPGIWEQFEDNGFDVTHGNKIKKAHYIRGLIPYLRNAGVLDNKHVPQVYLRASRQQRLALLQGLMDTDGHACESGSVEFVNTNLQIVESVVELAISLGHKARMTEGRAMLYGKDCGPKYRVKWTPRDSVFRLQRKMDRQKIARRRTCRFRYIVACDRIDPVPMRCITVSAPSGLFLVGRAMIPTHNSALLRWALLAQLIGFANAGLRNVRVGLFSSTYATLKDRQISKIQAEFPPELGEVRESTTDGLGYFMPSEKGGGAILLRNLDDPTKYRSAEFGSVAVDELTENEESVFDALLFRMRHPRVNRPKFFAGTNPGGLGHHWVRKLWITGEFDERFNGIKDQFKYIPAKVDDNPYLDPGYVKKLNALPEHLRLAVRDGSWDVFQGQMFGTFNREINVVRSYEIPKWWSCFGANDPGYTDPAVWYIFAVSEGGDVHCIREFTFIGVHPSEQAKQIAKDTEGLNVNWWVTGMDAFNTRPETGRSWVDYYISGGLTGFRMPVHGAGSRKTRAITVQEHLKPIKSPDGPPTSRVRIHDCCRKLIESSVLSPPWS